MYRCSDAADRRGTSLYVSAEFDSGLSGRSSFCNGNRKCSSVFILSGYRSFLREKGAFIFTEIAIYYYKDKKER